MQLDSQDIEIKDESNDNINNNNNNNSKHSDMQNIINFKPIWSSIYKSPHLILSESNSKVMGTTKFTTGSLGGTIRTKNVIQKNMIYKLSMEIYYSTLFGTDGLFFYGITSNYNQSNKYTSKDMYPSDAGLQGCYGILENGLIIQGSKSKPKEPKWKLYKIPQKKLNKIDLIIDTTKAISNKYLLMTYYINSKKLTLNDKNYTFKVFYVDNDEDWYPTISLCGNNNYSKLY